MQVTIYVKSSHNKKIFLHHRSEEIAPSYELKYFIKSFWLVEKLKIHRVRIKDNMFCFLIHKHT